jgi:MarR family transcriptional regulator for hemolysin
MFIINILMNNPSSPQRLDETLGYLVLDVGRLMAARFDARARALGITRAQWSLIAAVVRGEGSTQAQLAEWMQLTPISVGRLVDRMQKAGWVERRSEPSDRRAYRIYLTEKAHAIRPELRRLSAQTEQEALGGLDAAGRKWLLSSLASVRLRLTEMPAVSGRGRNGHG